MKTIRMKITLSPNAGRSRQTGVSLLEVLIAILILSFGMLGMLGLIINSYKLTSSSNYRTIAAQQAYSMADTLRSNVLILAKFQNPSGSTTANCLKSAGCTSDEMYVTDFAMWSARLASMLPAGAGTVCSDATPNDGVPGAWACDAVAANPTGPFVVKVCWIEGQSWQVTTANDGTKTSDWECVRTNL